MEKAFSLLVFIIFFIMVASAENNGNTNTCVDGLGSCQQCDERCKAKHGSEAKGGCDPLTQLCTCYYPCGPAPEPKKCYGGTGMCSDKCGPECCNQNCAQRYYQGAGFCESIGHYYLCKCQYDC